MLGSLTLCFRHTDEAGIARCLNHVTCVGVEVGFHPLHKLYVVKGPTLHQFADLNHLQSQHRGLEAGRDAEDAEMQQMGTCIAWWTLAASCQTPSTEEGTPHVAESVRARSIELQDHN